MRTSDAGVREACENLTAGRAVLPVAGVEAQALRQLLRIQGLSGVAARAIEDGSLELPERIASAVTQDWQTSRAWCEELDRECERIAAAALEAQAAAGLSAPVLLKGRAVARRYHDPTVRTYVDIDLLVPVGEIRAWSDLLRRLGYWAPEPEVEATRRRYQEGVSFTSGRWHGGFSCDLHGCLFIEHRARCLTYVEVAGRSEVSAFPGLLEPRLDMQLVVLALHLAHHTKDTWRLIWLRDFLELATPDAVESARSLAREYGVGWALELALHATEAVLHTPRWGTSPPRELSLLARVHQVERSGYLRHLVLARDLGARAGAWYLWSRVTPRRFVKPDGLDRQALSGWLRRVSRRSLRTSWSVALRRRL